MLNERKEGVAEPRTERVVQVEPGKEKGSGERGSVWSRRREMKERGRQGLTDSHPRLPSVVSPCCVMRGRDEAKENQLRPRRVELKQTKDLHLPVLSLQGLQRTQRTLRRSEPQSFSRRLSNTALAFLLEKAKTNVSPHLLLRPPRRPSFPHLSSSSSSAFAHRLPQSLREFFGVPPERRGFKLSRLTGRSAFGLLPPLVDSVSRVLDFDSGSVEADGGSETRIRLSSWDVVGGGGASRRRSVGNDDVVKPVVVAVVVRQLGPASGEDSSPALRVHAG